jgi:predicted nuclease of restriction endonuclease-like RecB superfamily
VLTRGLIKFRLNKGVVYPLYCSINEESLNFASRLIDACSRSVLRPIGDLEDELARLCQESKHPQGPGLSKIILGRCKQIGADTDLTDWRWRILLKSQETRRDSSTFQEFKGKITAFAQCATFTEVVRKIYRDQTNSNAIQRFEAISPRDLIDQHNLALLSGILGHCENGRFDFSRVDASIFHQAILKARSLGLSPKPPDTSPATTQTFELDGPLARTEAQATYSEKFQALVQNVILEPGPSFTGKICIDTRQGLITLNNKNGSVLSSHCDSATYQSCDLTKFIDDFNASSAGWLASQNLEYLLPAQGSACLPNLKLTNQGQQDRIFVEFFFPWQGSEYSTRLREFHRFDESTILLGVAKELVKRYGQPESLKSKKLKKGLFFDFKTRPTPNDLIYLLNRS